MEEPLIAIFSVLVLFSVSLLRGAGKYNNKKNQRGRIEKNALPLFTILLNHFFFPFFLRFLRSKSNRMSKIMRMIGMTTHTIRLLLSVV